jgi:cell division septation protein DedD
MTGDGTDVPEGERESEGGARMRRDMHRWKDRTELSLDNRQLFALYFGGAAALAVVFMLGIVVGKRLEARAREQALPVRSDPLAALDELDQPEAPAPRSKPSAPRLPRPVGSISSARIGATPGPGPAGKPMVAAPIKKPLSPDAAASESLAPPSTTQSAKPPARYTLQLSAFQDRSEAEEFGKKLNDSGYKPTIVAADIPGRGVWYRVRVGEYATSKLATDAKAELERKLHLTAYVTRM